MSKPLRVLYVYGGTMKRGGMEAYMMNYYRHVDRSKLQIDFLIHGFDKGVYDDEIIELGGKLYHIPSRRENYFRSINEMRKVFLSKKDDYRIVHSHMDAANMYALREAKRCNIPIRVSHSHNTQYLTKNKLLIWNLNRCRANIHKYATHFYACSQAAGDWLYKSTKAVPDNIEIIHNAIDYSLYSFNPDTRKSYRTLMNVENDFVVGHVGRLDYQKNQLFLVEIFSAIKALVENAKLIVVGTGSLREKLEEKINALGLKDSVLLLGSRDDIPQLLNSFDAFLLPSLFEGLPVSLIEAQANGLRCFTSDRVTKESNILNYVDFIPLEEDVNFWAKRIVEKCKKDNDREISKSKFVESGYDIISEAEKLQNAYLELGGA